MALPSHIDEYTTHQKCKYLSGLVSTTTSSVLTAGGDDTYKCDASLEIIDSAGTTYYIPLYTLGAA